MTRGVTTHEADKLRAGQESWTLMQFQTTQASCPTENLQISDVLYQKVVKASYRTRAKICVWLPSYQAAIEK